MKNILFLMILCFVGFNLYGQTVSEKLIVTLPSGELATAYSVKYDKPTGSFAYEDYDTTSKTAVLICPKGKSGSFSGINSYNAFFDKDGNVYVAAYNIVSDTVYKYSLLKNTEAIGNYDYINDTWSEKNGTLYFSAKENGKAFLMMLDLATGNITKGNPYEEIMFVYFPDKIAVEGEPVGYPGFTSNGSVYYVAQKDGKKFVVIGTTEQKQYADIDYYYFTTDKNGELSYVANDIGTMYETTGATFVVQGTKEYKKFDYVYGPILFDKDNEPVYIGADKSNSFIYTQWLMKGNTEQSKKYNSGISNFMFTPAGKLAYVGSTAIDSTHSYSNLVIDGKVGKKFDNIYNITFPSKAPSTEMPMYIATKGSKSYIMSGDDELTDAYDNIVDYKFTADGKLYYTTAVYGNYEKKTADKYYFHIDNESFGPYDFIAMGEEGGSTFLKNDNEGNYVYAAYKLVDKKNYFYEYTVYSNRGKSPSFDMVDNVMIMKGKSFFAGYKTYDKTKGLSKITFYGALKPISGEYDYISTGTVDEKSGVVSFVAAKGSDVYYLQVIF